MSFGRVSPVKIAQGMLPSGRCERADEIEVIEHQPRAPSSRYAPAICHESSPGHVESRPVRPRVGGDVELPGIQPLADRRQQVLLDRGGDAGTADFRISDPLKNLRVVFQIRPALLADKTGCRTPPPRVQHL